MVSPDINAMDSSEIDSFEASLIDPADIQKQKDEDFESSLVDASEYSEATSKEPSWLESVGDYFAQAGRSVLRLFTWPADLIKASMIGEGLSDLEELELAFERAGKPFNREEYVKNVMEQSRFFPTQDLAEEGFEALTGYSLKPKSKAAELIGKGTELMAFTPGGIAKKALAGMTGIATQEALKAAGVSEGKAEFIGSTGTLPYSLVKETTRKLGKEATKLAKTADQFGLPFLEYMARERAPYLKGRLFDSAQQRLQNAFNWNAAEALNNVIQNNSLARKLRDRGVNLQAFSEYAYDTVRSMASRHKKPYNMQSAVDAIDARIAGIKAKAPSPSEAQLESIRILERERDLLAASQPTAEQLIEQHMNYNSNVKDIYRKPEFAGKEDEVRKTYAFLNETLVNTMEKQGSEDVSNAFKAANKIYAEKQALEQSESILSKFLDGESYDPKKLDSLLAGKKGKILRRQLGDKAVDEMQEIATYGVKAQKRMNIFLDNAKGPVVNEIRSWGRLAPFLLTPYGVKAAGVALAKPVARIIQGKLLTRPATRKAYTAAMKHASEGAFNLLKKDFADLNESVSAEFGSVENFIDVAMEDVALYE